MLNILRVNGIGITFTKRKIVYCVKEVCFSHSIVPNETIDFSRKIKICLTNIFIIQYGDGIQTHNLV